MDKEALTPAFTTDEIEDVRIIIKAKGKHWALVPNPDYTADEAKQIRILSLNIICGFHTIVDTALEDMPKK